MNFSDPPEAEFCDAIDELTSHMETPVGLQIGPYVAGYLNGQSAYKALLDSRGDARVYEAADGLLTRRNAPLVRQVGRDDPRLDAQVLDQRIVA